MPTAAAAAAAAAAAVIAVAFGFEAVDKHQKLFHFRIFRVEPAIA